MKKLICAALALLLFFGAAACSSGGGSLPEGFDEEETVSLAKSAVKALSEKDYETVASYFSPAMGDFGATELEDALDAQIDALGPFDSFASEAHSSGSDPGIGEYAVLVLVCKYEKGRATYTISVDENQMICGLYMK